MLGLATRTVVHKGLQLISVRHPRSLARKIGESTAGFLECAGLTGVILLLCSENFASVFAANLELALDIDAVLEDAVDHL